MNKEEEEKAEEEKFRRDRIISSFLFNGIIEETDRKLQDFHRSTNTFLRRGQWLKRGRVESQMQKDICLVGSVFEDNYEEDVIEIINKFGKY